MLFIDGASAVNGKPPSPVDFIRDYYAEVAARDYDASWSQLAPEFQRGKAVSFDYYVGFWNENDVEVGEVAVVRAGERDATLHVDLRWNRSGPWLTDEFALREEDGGWLIAAQKTLD